MAKLREDYGVGAGVANPPPYWTDEYIRRHVEGQELPVSEDLARRILCPSLHPLMSEADNEYVAAAISEGIEQLGEQMPALSQERSGASG
jgi:dTDP-4-amino-4,6-dideoxygalactose transaminase